MIIGAGGHGREMASLVVAHNAAGREPHLNVRGFLTHNPEDHGKTVNDLPVLGPERWVLGRKDMLALIAVGDPRVRARLARELSAEGVRFATLIHPSASLSDRVAVGEGTMVCAGAVITVEVRVGRHVIVNVGASVSHDAVLEDFVTLGPGVRIPGGVRVSAGAEFGTNSCTIPRVHVGRGAIVGAGAVVVRDVEENCVVVGVPARMLRKLPEQEWF